MIENHHHRENIIKQVQEQLGKDIDQTILEDVAKHMEECPDCKIYVDSVQETVKIYKVTESEQTIPNEVSDRLFKVLNLKKVE